MAVYVVFASFEVEATSEDEALNDVTDNMYISDASEVWIQGVLDAEGKLV